MIIDTIRWNKTNVKLIDQRLLPGELKYVECFTDKDIYEAIKKMKVRGAPAIGVAGAYGVYLGARESKAKDIANFKKDLKKTIKYLATARPTARNLFWALEEMEKVIIKYQDKSISLVKNMLFKKANDILKEDIKICRTLGKHGAKLFKKNSTVLTHCNAGGLATGGYGTALGVILSAAKKIKQVYADETRPVLQGGRLTVWELVKYKIPVILICDNMAASRMAEGKINAVVVGADRISSNGDTANKIGTYNLAILAKYHKIPFYVAAPVSTFDLLSKTGKDISIEERSPDEVRKMGNKNLTVKNVRVENPSFDVTPVKLITAIITERGVIQRPTRTKIKKVIE